MHKNELLPRNACYTKCPHQIFFFWNFYDASIPLMLGFFKMSMFGSCRSGLMQLLIEWIVFTMNKKFKVKIGFVPKGLMYIIQTLLIRFIASFRLIIPYNTARLITLIIFKRNWKIDCSEDIYVQNRSLGSYFCVSNETV